MHNISSLQLISFPLFNASDSFLVVYEGKKTIPFEVNRIFMVNSIEQSVRGFHAHKECSQLLVVMSGGCKVTCDDGMEKKDIILTKASEGLLIPPTIWAEQEYQSNTILMVLTDKPYSEDDYIRDYDDFLAFRGNK